MESLLEYGYVGLFIASFLAATIIPFSSDILLVGLLAAGGNPVTTVIVATLGNWLGGLSSYYLGYLGKWEWLEKYFKVSREKLEKQKSKVARFGAALALITWFPIIGDIFAIALGFYRLPFIPTAIYMLIGKGGRFIVWAIIYFYSSQIFS